MRLSLEPAVNPSICWRRPFRAVLWWLIVSFLIVFPPARPCLSDSGLQWPGTGGPAGLIGVDIKSYGAAGDGSSDDTEAFQSAAQDLRSSGKTLHIPPGVYKLTGGFTVSGFRLRGAGVYDWEKVTRFGSVLALGGALESSSDNVITIDNGGVVEDVVFFYPGQSATADRPLVTASGFVLSCSSKEGRRGCIVRNNWLVNVNYGIKNTDGWARIEGNFVNAMYTAFHDDNRVAEHYFRDNSVSYGIWLASINQKIRYFISRNATAFHLENSSAQFTDNTVFGVNIGIDIRGGFPFLSWTGGLIDGTRYPVNAAPGHGPGRLLMSNTTLMANVAGRPHSTRSEDVTLETSAITIGDPARPSDWLISNSSIGGSNGDVIKVTNTAGKAAVTLSVSNSKIVNPGRFAHSHIISVTRSSGVFANGDTITGSVSGAKAFVLKWDAGAGRLYVKNIAGTFRDGEAIAAGPSGAKAFWSSTTAAPYYHALLFDDRSGGSLMVNGCELLFQRYPWQRGIYVTNAGNVRIMGNHFESKVKTVQNALNVAAAERLVEQGNTSDMAGTDADVVLEAIRHRPVSGGSGWSRTVSGY